MVTACLMDLSPLNTNSSKRNVCPEIVNIHSDLMFIVATNVPKLGPEGDVLIHLLLEDWLSTISQGFWAVSFFYQ